MNLFDHVELTRDLPADPAYEIPALPAGTRGAVVEVFGSTWVWVEFMEGPDTLAVIEVDVRDLQSVPPEV